MHTSETAQLQTLIDRIVAGEAARKDLIARSHRRLLQLARKIFHEDFADMRGDHETGSILNRAVVRLLEDLPKLKTQPRTVLEYFRFSAVEMRRVLLDLARQYRRKRKREPSWLKGRASEGSQRDFAANVADRSPDPAKIAMWTEFLQKTESLPEQERDVVFLHKYHGLDLGEAAKYLGLSKQDVRNLWASAEERLSAWMAAARKTR